jgi:hypothetical protein
LSTFRQQPLHLPSVNIYGRIYAFSNIFYRLSLKGTFSGENMERILFSSYSCQKALPKTCLFGDDQYVLAALPNETDSEVPSFLMT